MTDMLVLTERVKNAIQLGESHFREFKIALTGAQDSKRPRPWDSIAKDIGEALVAFANADGGDLLIGVEDDGSITGIPHSQHEIEQLLAATVTHVHPNSLLPVQIATELKLEDQSILLFSVQKGTTGIFQLHDGRCVRRSGTSTLPESVDRILFDQREARSRAYDTEFVDGAQVTDLDIPFLESTARSYLHGITPEKYLQQLGLADYSVGGLRLRRAALLLFAKDISKWHPRSQVRVLKVAGTKVGAGEQYNVVSDEVAQGNIFDLLGQAWERLRPFLAYATEFGPDTRFEQKFIYPEGAFNEALVNALAHRDYSVHNAVEVFIFDERMEIRSPGPLLSTLTLDQLVRLDGVHESRNALVARVMRESRFMRELGEGMKRIFELMWERDLRPPELASDEASFTVTLYHKSVFSEQQLAWLSLFEHTGLSKLQQRIMVAAMHDRVLAPRDIYRSISTNDRDTYDREVTSLRVKGLLIEVMTNPSATALARRTGRPKASIPRFRAVIPDQAATHPSADLSPEEETPPPYRPALRIRPTVFIGGVPQVIDREALYEFVIGHGELIELRVMEEKGIAFAEFATEGAAKSLVAVRQAAVDGHLLRFAPARPRGY